MRPCFTSLKPISIFRPPRKLGAQTKHNIQPRKELRGENEVLASEGYYWVLFIHRATFNLTQYVSAVVGRAQVYLYHLKTNAEIQRVSRYVAED